jgi:hypothetical protein
VIQKRCCEKLSVVNAPLATYYAWV